MRTIPGENNKFPGFYLFLIYVKKGQKLIKIELGFSRSYNSSQQWILWGEVLKKFKLSCSYGRVAEAINFPKPPFKETGRKDKLFEFYYNGVVLVKIIYPSGDYDYGVGLFWVDLASNWLWYQKGYVCLLSDIEGKRYLKKQYEERAKSISN